MALTIHLSKTQANGIDYALLECGVSPLSLCLQGFPESAHTWRHLLPCLLNQALEL